jgi:hypothetical protein
MSVLPDLRESLVRAAARQAPARRRPVWRVLPVAFAAAIAVVVAVIALGTLHHRAAPRGEAGSSSVPGRQALIDILAPLRRAQTPADLRLRGLSLLEGQAQAFGLGRVDVPLVRYAGTTPWGERLFIVPFLPSAGRHDETVGLESAGGGGGGIDAAGLAAHGVDESEGAGRSFAGGSTKSRLIVLVPDGVARVEFVLSRQPNGNQYGAPTYARVQTVTVGVHGNLAAVQVDRGCCGASGMIWYRADGSVIRRIGNIAGAGRVLSPPRPGPETPLSRAAQRDPSTPNPVWVAPAVGGPRTRFTIHFRVLLNGADYRYRFTGTPCPAFTFPGGTGKPNALRGSLWSDGVGAVQGESLCPGSYRVSVTVMDFGRGGGPRQPAARPFGSASFTVRR